MGKKPATYDDLRRLPDNVVGEIIDGELFVSPRPALPHSNAYAVLGGEINHAFHRPPGGGDRPGGWWILDEPELHFGQNVLVPDIAGWRRERMPKLPKTAALELAPDWVCEIISPSTGRLDRAKKAKVYAARKVQHMWLIDPLQQTLENYRLNDEGRWVLLETLAGALKARVVPFDAIELELARLWPETEDPK